MALANGGEQNFWEKTKGTQPIVFGTDNALVVCHLILSELSGQIGVALPLCVSDNR